MSSLGRVGPALTLLFFARMAFAGDVVDSWVRREMELNSLPGVTVVVVRNGREDLVRAYGVANVETGEPLTPETLIELASVSKTFTGLALLHVVASKAIDPNDLVVAHLPELKHVADERWLQLRVRHLARHRSGLRREHDFQVPCCGKPGDRDLGLAVQKLRNVKLASQPGRVYRYANSNYVLLAAIIERVSGLPFATFLDERVIRPLALERTTVDLERAGRDGMATLHEWQWGKVRVSPSTFLGWYGSSLVKSSGSDMSRYLRALLSREVLGITDWRGHLESSYDFGWHVNRAAAWLDREMVLEHGGNLWGVNTAVALAPRKRAGAAVLINLGTKRAEPMARALLRYASGHPLRATASVRPNEIPDNWAIGFAVSGGVLCTASAWYLMRLRQRNLEGGRFSVTSATSVARGLLMGGLAVYLPYALYGAGPPIEAMPASIQVALPPLVWSASVLLLLIGIGAFLKGAENGLTTRK